jgi:hypothetical protein
MGCGWGKGGRIKGGKGVGLRLGKRGMSYAGKRE